MKWEQHKKQILATSVFAFFVVTGTYNAIVINSESILSNTDIRFVKRLDEIYGETKYGKREMASIKWQKVSGPVSTVAKPQIQFKPKASSSVSSSSDTVAESSEVAAAIQDSLNLTMSDVSNSNIWKATPARGSFSGELVTNQGVVEVLNVSLPGGAKLPDGTNLQEGASFSVNLAKMEGNIFQYQLDNETYSAMIFQSNQSTYMVNLSNGPFADTRLTFVAEPSEEQKESSQRELAEMSAGNAYEVNDQEAQGAGEAMQAQAEATQTQEAQAEVTPESIETAAPVEMPEIPTPAEFVELIAPPVLEQI